MVKVRSVPSYNACDGNDNYCNESVDNYRQNQLKQLEYLYAISQGRK